MKKWKLHRISSSFPIEDCFVIAKTARQAARLEEDEDGFNPGDVTTERVMTIPVEIEKLELHEHQPALRSNNQNKNNSTINDHCWPDFVGRALSNFGSHSDNSVS